MYATEHRTHGDPAQPYVAMTTPEAVALDKALSDAIGTVRLAIQMGEGLREPLSEAVMAQARRNLACLEEFIAAHGKAHGLAR